MAKQEGAIIIVKRIKKGGHAAHHGGSWKVAYADFVTAMMAFFLLLWLLSSTTEEQRLGLADYFSPIPGTIASTTGGEGLMAGQSMATEGPLIRDRATPGVMVMVPEETTPPEEGEEKDTAETTEEEAEEIIAEREREQFEQAEKMLSEALDESDELKNLGKSLIIDQTPEGMRIQIVDQEGVAMFARGRTSMGPEAKKLISLVVMAIEHLPNKVTITGHTDATQYARYGYDNWDLSTDRANSSRRAMLRAGFDSSRIFRVTGRAAGDLIDNENPTAPINRRISIVLLRHSHLKKFEREKEKLSGELLEKIKAEDEVPAATSPEAPPGQPAEAQP